jgi:hypothetical protein
LYLVKKFKLAFSACYTRLSFVRAHGSRRKRIKSTLLGTKTISSSVQCTSLSLCHPGFAFHHQSSPLLLYFEQITIAVSINSREREELFYNASLCSALRALSLLLMLMAART